MLISRKKDEIYCEQILNSIKSNYITNKFFNHFIPTFHKLDKIIQHT